MSHRAVTEKMHYGVYSVVVAATCDACRRQFTLVIPEDHWLAWMQGGQLIQKAMPTLTESERELLISGTCERCFAALFPDDLDEADATYA